MHKGNSSAARTRNCRPSRGPVSRPIIQPLDSSHNKFTSRRACGLGASLALLLLAGCSDLNWPFHHPGASDTAAPDKRGAEGDQSSAECANIRAQIKDNEETRREAPATTTDANIVNAAQAKADKRIDDLRQRADALDCPNDTSAGESKGMPPLQPAPGGGNK